MCESFIYRLVRLGNYFKKYDLCSVDKLFAVVLTDRARDTKSDEIVALKKVRMDKEKDGKIAAQMLMCESF